ncbi:hypothetical protein HPB49_019388 [Dermacentor silvarum]|uniref:Uncharacterized protein n=1 Tax=Dermacentor silvarum TaxID=543639 RepID=A0ACB8D7V9_DERSI|nr:hypothetical protein HPB49_019388 [Dermacentor silvarum]
MARHIKTTARRRKPNVIILQETCDHAKIAGYATHKQRTKGTEKHIVVTTLVKKGVVTIPRIVRKITDISHIRIEVAPRSKRESRAFVLNVYSSPSKKGLTHNFEDLFNETMTTAGDNRLIIGGDFNAAHTQWGYGHSSRKGKDLADLIEKAGLTLLNKPASHTRVDAGPHRDTTPNLTLCRSAGRITWENTFDDVGSDHRILSITLGEPRATKGKKTRSS